MGLRWLELKIPPPLAALLTALIMWRLAPLGPSLQLAPTVRDGAALALVALAASCDLAALVSFRRARTTINPLRPEAARALVVSGIYRFTRNPMYLGLALLLTAWGFRLGSAAALPAVPLFCAYLKRFQIVPEEKVLAQRFGVAYDAYRARVRRWL